MAQNAKNNQQAKEEGMLQSADAAVINQSSEPIDAPSDHKVYCQQNPQDDMLIEMIPPQ